MINSLQVSAGQCTQSGTKTTNEDCCGIRIPEGPLLDYKGIAAVCADGVGSSQAGREASEACVQGFLSDYYSTPDSLSVKTAGQRVINALNSWLYSQSQKFTAQGLGLASTMSVLVLKSRTAHIFHVGDSRIYLLRKNTIRCLTRDHRLQTGQDKSYLTRAMGAELNVQLDYEAVSIEAGDIFVLTTDGIHECLSPKTIQNLILETPNDLEQSATTIINSAIEAGSQDNLTCQILRIELLANRDENEFYRELTQLPFPPDLESGAILDGYKIVRPLHTSPTIQVYLAEDASSDATVVVKTPSVNFVDHPAYIERFIHEEWVGRRINNPHVLRVHRSDRKHHFLYYVTDYIEGRSLAQWIIDNPKPELEQVREIATQLVNGLRAFHRVEMVHQDIKPENIMIDKNGKVTIIDFGCTLISGQEETYTPTEQYLYLGTHNYIAPELIDGSKGTPTSDLYSLGVTIYELLSGGSFPYGDMGKRNFRKHQSYVSLRKHNADVPVWMDRAIQKAVSFDPSHRYQVLSEFLYDLAHPNTAFLKTTEPLIEKNPVGFWIGVSIVLLIINLILLFMLARK